MEENRQFVLYTLGNIADMNMEKIINLSDVFSSDAYWFDRRAERLFEEKINIAKNIYKGAIKK